MRPGRKNKWKGQLVSHCSKDKRWDKITNKCHTEVKDISINSVIPVKISWQELLYIASLGVWLLILYQHVTSWEEPGSQVEQYNIKINHNLERKTYVWLMECLLCLSDSNMMQCKMIYKDVAEKNLSDNKFVAERTTVKMWIVKCRQN